MFCSTTLLGQHDKAIDSLSTLVRTTNDPAEKIKILRSLASVADLAGHEGFNGFYSQLVDLSRKTNDNYNLAIAQEIYAIHLFHQNKLSEAATYYQKNRAWR